MNRQAPPLRLRPWILAACALGFGFKFSSPVSAIVIRDDVADSAYTNLGNSTVYSSVGVVNESTGFSGGILISPKWVLSAAHVVAATPSSFVYNGTSTTDPNRISVGINQFFINPQYPNTGNSNVDLPPGQDIGLIQLSSIPTVAPSSRYFASNDLGRQITYVGYGETGTGLTGRVPNSEGIKRAATNTLDINGGSFSGYSTNLMVSDFDDPANADGYNLPNGATLPTNLEGMVSFNDSGGGVFLDNTVGANTRSYVQGVTSFFGAIASGFGDGVLNASYSDLTFSTRLNGTQANTGISLNEWIDNSIDNNWKTASDGAFGTAGNWSVGTFTSGTPGNGDIAGFNVAGNYTVTLGSNITNHQLLARQGSVTLNLGGFKYDLTSTMYEGGIVVGRYAGNNATVTFTGGTVTSHDAIIGMLGDSTGQINVGAATTWNVTGDVYVGGSFGDGSFDGSGGQASLNVQNSNSIMTVSGTMKVFGSGTVNFNAGSLSVGSLYVHGGHVNVATGANRVLRIGSVVSDNGGKIDLNDNDLIANSTTLSAIQTLITTGYNSGAWTGSGIASSKATASPSGGEGGKTGLGFGTAGSLSLTTFDGVSVTSSDVLVKYTYLGDANLDGKVDLLDMIRFAANWMTSGQTWVGGDFNYDGTVNVKDLTLLARNWQVGTSSPLSEPFDTSLLSSFGISLSAVPEPAGLTLLALAAISLQRRRKRA